MIAAAMAAVSPVVACADFCPQPIAGEIVTTARTGDNVQTATSVARTIAEDCDKTEGAAPTGPSQTHDPDCQGCSDCPAIASVKAPALASAGAVIVDAPTFITIDLIASPIANFFHPSRHRLTPPANGPPIAATPVLLKDILRL